MRKQFKMKKKDFMKKKIEELPKMLKGLKKELFNLSSASLAGEDSLKKKSKLKVVRRDIARINTRLNSK